jgi:hypothetical protein
MQAKSRLVQVEWNDSNVMHGWRLGDCLTDDDLAHCRTFGLLMVDDDKKVVIAFGDSDCGSVMETVTIPKTCITRIRDLRVK